MKKILLSLLLIASCASFAEAQLAANGVVIAKDTRRIKTLPNGTTGQVLTSNGTSAPSWQTAGGGIDSLSLWIKTDMGSPVQAPSVTAGTKGLAFGDTAIVSAFGGIALGNRSSITHLDGVAIGQAAQIKSAFSTGIGAFAFEASNSTNGQNTLIGYSSSCNGSSDEFNTVIGASTNTTGNQNTVCGSGGIAQGNFNISLGANSGDGLTHNNRILISSATGSPHTAGFDSVVMIGGKSLTARNASEYVFGASNLTGSNFLLQFSDGGRHGNASTFDVLSAKFDGTVIAGKNFQSTLRTITNSNDAGTTGEICYDASFIYICVNTNTWKRVAIATW